MVPTIRKESIDVVEIIHKILPKVLIKNLQENERICPVTTYYPFYKEYVRIDWSLYNGKE